MNFSSTLGFRAAGAFTGAFDDHGVYIALGLIQLVVTALVFAIDPSEARRKLPRPDGTPLAGKIAAALLVVVLGWLTIYVLPW